MILTKLAANPDYVRNKRVLEMGTGSGVIALTALQLGASFVTATDTDPAAIDATQRLFQDADMPQDSWECIAGGLWEPIAATSRYDLVLANLPHFPSAGSPNGESLSAWNAGGADGRQLLDPFILGLSQYLTPDGMAVFTQNEIVGDAKTIEMVRSMQMQVKRCDPILIPLDMEKRKHLTPGYESRDGFFAVGKHSFLKVALFVVTRRGVG